ncbi:MAG: M48 family metalloprotease [Granulosicoccus sp.]
MSDKRSARPVQALARHIGLVMLLGWLFMPSMSASAQQNLPSMGEPADSTLSPAEERELGAGFMRQIRASLPLVNDVQLNEFIQSLGVRLVMATGDHDSSQFQFFVINDPQINAFAIPGGYIGINSGLITAMDQEEQLASVMAHEIAHVTQRHHARSFATGNRASLSAAATVLAAIIIGQASPEVGQAALAAGLAATQQSAINYTRANEVEADRIGIEILSNAQYDPLAMAESFAILRRKNSLNTSSWQLEYLRTHPLDNNRIAEATDRAAGKPRKVRVQGTDYQLFRARLAVLSATDLPNLQRVMKAQHTTAASLYTAYALALIHHQANRQSRAREYLEELDDLIRAHPMVEMLRADILGKDKAPESERELEALSELYPERYSLIEKRLELLIDDRQITRARDVATEYLRRSSRTNPLAWRELASIEELLNDKAGSHEALARYFESTGELSRAANQLELAIREVPPDSQDDIRMKASLESLREGMQ